MRGRGNVLRPQSSSQEYSNCCGGCGRSLSSMSTLAPRRGHARSSRGHVNVDVCADDATTAAGWPLARHGKPLEGGSAMGSRAACGGSPLQGHEELERGELEILAQEVEELIERQPQFAFLKPCRQLEKHYANKRAQLAGNSGSGSSSSSFRHGHGESRSTMASKEKGTMEKEAAGRFSSSESRVDDDQKPGSTIRELLSCDGIEFNSFNVEGCKAGAQGASPTERVVTKKLGSQASPKRRASERQGHGRGGHFHRLSGERIWRISSTRCSIHEKEAHIDLVAPAAAKFLVEMSPGQRHHTHASPPAVAVPFKWEDAPGRAKAHAAATANPTLQLPPRLAVPLQRSSENLSRQLRVSVISHPLATFFPCMRSTSSPSPSNKPSQQQQDHLAWMHYRASKGYGGVHQEPTLFPGNQRKMNKSFSQPLAKPDNQSNGLKPRRLFSSELAPPSSEYHHHPSSSSSILHGSRQSSSSRTNYLSCELDASTPRTAGSKSSSSASYESVGEDFDQDDSASPHSCTHKAAAAAPPPMHPISERRHARHAQKRSEPPGVKGLLKLCKHNGKCLGKSKSRNRHHHPLCSPEIWAPTLATYFQRLDVNDNEPAMSTGLLDKQAAGAPTSSGYLNSKGEPIPLQNPNHSTDGSPERPTRLPYKMPSVAEQERGRHIRKSSHVARRSWDLCPSPAYSAALEMLSPAAATIMTSARRHRGSRTLPSPKPHRRVQFILSMCKTLKRVLFRQQPRRSVIGTTLMYHDERHAPTTFQFSKPN